MAVAQLLAQLSALLPVRLPCVLPAGLPCVLPRVLPRVLPGLLPGVREIDRAMMVVALRLPRCSLPLTKVEQLPRQQVMIQTQPQRCSGTPKFLHLDSGGK
jgi:hypothetical protein